ncbi:hypothetical protein N9414_01210 [Nodularia spumigena CCY9414]|nr:hypothetical protein N9414_01210 [Nodularia spumigena CCY9414]
MNWVRLNALIFFNPIENQWFTPVATPGRSETIFI